MAESKSLRVVYDEALIELDAENDKAVVMDADLARMTVINTFTAKYPGHFFNFGVTEANMVYGAVGFVHSGFLLFVSAFALFGAGHAHEQTRNSVGYVNADVKFGLSRSSLCVGKDGSSHQLTEDIMLVRVLPDMTIFVSCDAVGMRKIVFAAAEIDRSVYIYVARPVYDTLTKESDPFIPSKANVLKDGGDVCTIAADLMIPEALKATGLLEKDGVSAAVANMYTIKPIDSEIILTMTGKCGAIVTTGEYSIVGGLGSVVVEVLVGRSVAKFARIGIQDRFGRSGKPTDLFKAYGLTAENIAETRKVILKQNTDEDRGMGRLFPPFVRW